MRNQSAEAILREQLEAVQTQRRNDLERMQRMTRTCELLRFELAQRNAELRNNDNEHMNDATDVWQSTPTLVRYKERNETVVRGSLIKPLLSALLLRFARSAAKRNDYAAAETLYQAIALFRPRTFLWWQIGNMLSGQGLFKAAVMCFERAIVEDPEYADAYLALGNALRQLGEDRRARNAFAQATALGLKAGSTRHP